MCVIPNTEKRPSTLFRGLTMNAILMILLAMSDLGNTHNIPEHIKKSVIYQESRGKSHAVSHCGARGQMQVMWSSVCRGCKTSDPLAQLLHVDAFNHYFGTRILSRWLKRAARIEKGRNSAAWARALAAYNAGHAGLYAKGPGQNYAKSVLFRARKYRKRRVN